MQRVFIDANIFYSRTLTDWTFLLHAHNQGMFQLHTSWDVCAEAIASLRDDNPKLEGIVVTRRMEHIQECVNEMIRTFPSNLPFTGKDKDDYHVHAAATEGRADLVLTCDKPEGITTTPDDEHYEVIHPDDFFVLIADSSPRSVMEVTDRQVDYWGKNPKYVQLDDMLRRAGCPRFADRVLECIRKQALRP